MASGPTWDTIAIVGVGLIGGSIGLALKKRQLCRQIIGIGRRPAPLRTAKQLGAIDVATTDWERGVASAQLVVVCTPVDQVVEHVRRVQAACPASTIITDVGSTKASIVAALDHPLTASDSKKSPSINTRSTSPPATASAAAARTAAARSSASVARFVGSHPMAGSERAGVRHASADLFDDKTVIVTPGATSLSADVRKVERWWRALGGRVVRMTPIEHDAAVASISHAPHLVAAALAAASPRQHLRLIGSGWRDTTRIAAGDPELWRQILLDNRQELLRSLASFSAVIDPYQQALQRGDSAALIKLLELGKKIRDAVGN
ncbi:MAG: prephenate dehydrogenase [Planctomycetota bacterium]